MASLNSPFYYEPHPLCVDAAHSILRLIAEHSEWQDEVDSGKMFGVLIIDTSTINSSIAFRLPPFKGGRGVGLFFAYSGQLLGRYDWEGFVPPVFDYLSPSPSEEALGGTYFKRKEAEIVNINERIRSLESSQELSLARDTLYNIERETTQKINAYKSFMAESKARREVMRAEGSADEVLLIKESQFQKAGLRRLKQSCDEQLSAIRRSLQTLQDEISELKAERKRRSDDLQRWLFEHFEMLNGRGEKKNLMDIFKEWAEKTGSKCITPPSGSGECCAPKLLQYAFQNNLTPLAIAEFTCIKGNIQWHGACQGRCAPILDWMLQGIEVEENPLHRQEKHTSLDVLYEDDYLLIVNKPAGMLSVPGKSSRLSALDIAKSMRPDWPSLILCHRLDMQTSGVLVLAKDILTYKKMQKMFLSHEKIKKTYIALLEGCLTLPLGGKGLVHLPLSPDYLNRPRQIVDRENGKPAITRYEIIGEKDGHTLVRLHPITGRTHQLRVHCAHPEGLNMPIFGDDLYGHHSSRLFLHAQTIDFEHPITGLHLFVTAPFGQWNLSLCP